MKHKSKTTKSDVKGATGFASNDLFGVIRWILMVALGGACVFILSMAAWFVKEAIRTYNEPYSIWQVAVWYACIGVLLACVDGLVLGFWITHPRGLDD